MCHPSKGQIRKPEEGFLQQGGSDRGVLRGWVRSMETYWVQALCHGLQRREWTGVEGVWADSKQGK